ncbi:glycosyltransferase family 2 protein [Frigidibacter sp. ROC022]|uniref:glycosyltransferase family 2 protein n=1 Tax=Frigidibacter sp. ROC022 TaxID=2971796 RepID=UPI00215A1F1B|nr:glycosyltransferase family A protein [Frigidibacter sp. ROC022]MCR8726837.1 glycosyltransferase family 2 protein [Frigidibacter sp. ROC022]
MTMKTTSPAVSFGMPVYNGARYLSEALDSLLAQDFPDFEIIISDNASTDETPDICASYAARDTRIKYYRLDHNHGAAFNYNRVFELSSGRYFKWAAHDDLIRPAFLSRCLEIFENHSQDSPPPAIVYPGSAFIDEAGKLVGPDIKVMHTLARQPWARAFHTVQNMGMAAPVFGLFAREALERTRLIDSFIASDYVLMFEAGLLGTIVRFNETLFLRRVHPGMSRLANTKKRDVLKWFSPSAKQRLPTRQRLFIEYHRSVWGRKEIGFFGKIACSVALSLGVWFHRIRVLQGYYRRKAMSRLQVALRR